MRNFFWSDVPSDSAFPLASAGYPFIFASVFTTAVFALLGLVTLSLMGLAATFFICYFFRDPDRVIPNYTGCVVSPADGKVVSAGLVDNSRFFEGSCIKVSIFMSIFNVHVNRMPIGGTVEKITYQPGRFFSANLDKASQYNENNRITLRTSDSRRIVVIQIAGLIARRIACWINEKEQVVAGQRFGLIRFGSRLEVFLPVNSKITAQPHQRVKAGETIIGYIS
jgi:phosphatidylserine decarboxylase